MVLIFFQFLINNLTIFYVDLFAIVLLSILLSGNFSWPQLIILSLIADLVGHWSLGSHLLAITILSIFTSRFVNFYRMCNGFQRNIISSVFMAFLILISYLVELATGKIFTSFRSILFEIVVLLPLVQFLLHKIVFKRPSEYFYND